MRPGQELDQIIASQIMNEMATPPRGFSTTWAYAWEMILRIKIRNGVTTGFSWDHANRRIMCEMSTKEMASREAIVAWGESVPHAACLGAVVMLELKLTPDAESEIAWHVMRGYR